jgi:hypothetical protein
MMARKTIAMPMTPVERAGHQFNVLEAELQEAEEAEREFYGRDSRDKPKHPEEWDIAHEECWRLQARMFKAYDGWQLMIKQAQQKVDNELGNIIEGVIETNAEIFGIQAFLGDLPKNITAIIQEHGFTEEESDLSYCPECLEDL